MLKYIEEHLENERRIKALKTQIEWQINKREERITRAVNQIQALERKKHKIGYASWIDDIVKPLMHDLEECAFTVTGEKWYGEIYGPFGIFARTTIYLRKDMEKSICDQPTYFLEVMPPDEAGKMYYGTCEFTNKYPVGSLADLNGENEIMADLPETLAEIWEVVHYTSY